MVARGPRRSDKGASSGDRGLRTIGKAARLINAASTRKGASEPRALHHYLRAAPIFDSARRLMALEEDLRRIQPSLKLRAVKLERQTLLVTAESAAVAARLRQFEPTLLAGLRARGWLVNRIRFRPAHAAESLRAQAAATRLPAQKPALSPTALAELERLLHELSARDDRQSPLAAVLATFIARQRSYRD